MKSKIYDSRETLMAGLKAEQETIVEYTRYLELARQNNNESEAKLWEHIIKDEEEHAKEFQNALDGNFKLLDSEREDTFYDRINDCLVDAGIRREKYSIKTEDYPWAYVDFGNEKEECRKAYEALRDSLFDAYLVNDDGFYYISIRRR